MIERTTLDLRLAEHRDVTARINAGDWQRPDTVRWRPARTVVATALVALASRLDPASRSALRGNAPLAPATLQALPFDPSGG